jgi:sigma-B regulation protein RsbU (phosphoserine phosphatase)
LQRFELRLRPPSNGKKAIEATLTHRELLTLQEENARLKRAIEELSILNDLARVIGASVNSQEIMQTIIHRSLRAVHAEQGVITLVDAQEGRTMKTLVRSMVTSGDHPRFHLDQSLLGWMHLNKKPLLINAPQADERFRGIQWDDAIRNALSVPLLIKAELIGVLTVYNKKDGVSFTDADQRLLAILAAQSAQVVENARLHEQEKALARMQEEVRLASKIQNDLLPKSVPPISGYEVAGISRPAQTIGGDYFDFIPLDDHRIAVCLGDVSGKGLPAALLMASLHATLRAQSVLIPTPRRCMERTNHFLHQSVSAEKFATLFYGILDTHTHTLSCANAGQDHPILVSGDRIVRLTRGGIPLGLMDPFTYEEEQHPVGPGDVLVVFSDGISEAWNAGDEMFGSDRLLKIVELSRGESAGQIMGRILHAVESFAKEVVQADDMTLVVVKRLPS